MSNYASHIALAKRLAVTLANTTIPHDATLPQEVTLPALAEVVAHFNNRMLRDDPYWPDLTVQAVTALMFEDPLPSWKSGRCIIEFFTPGRGYKYRLDIGQGDLNKFHVYEFKVSKTDLMPDGREVVLHAINAVSGFTLKYHPRNATSQALFALTDFIERESPSGEGASYYDSETSDMFEVLQTLLSRN